MPEEFVMRGQTESGKTETLSFSGHKPGYAFKMTEFSLYPSTNIGGDFGELVGTVTAGKTAITPTDVNFNDQGLIGTTFIRVESQHATEKPVAITVLNDTFLITQNLILMVKDQSSAGNPVNWQCRFVKVKMSGSQEAVTNYKQYMISDGS